MTRPEFDKFFGDRLIGMLVRQFGELRALAEKKGPDEKGNSLFDAARIGYMMSALIREGLAFRDEIAELIFPKDPKPDLKPAANGQPQSQSQPQRRV